PRQHHPQTAAFADLQEHHDPCGVTELAGKAVGAAFVASRPHASLSPRPFGNSTVEQDTTPSGSASPPRQPGVLSYKAAGQATGSGVRTGRGSLQQPAACVYLARADFPEAREKRP